MSDKKCKEAAPGAVALAQKGILGAVAVCQTPGDQYHGLVTRGGGLITEGDAPHPGGHQPQHPHNHETFGFHFGKQTFILFLNFEQVT